MFAYCLFCETQRCRIIARQIHADYGYTCFAPQIIQRKWIRGVMTEESHDWLPGYIFLFSEDALIPHFPIDGIIRCLGNKELSGPDLEFAEMLFQNNGVLGNVELIESGDRCIIADPSWKDMQGEVIRMDRGRKRCCVAIEFDGLQRTIWVGYEMLKTTERKPV